MLVVALLVAASIPVFTKKHRTIDNNSQHGKWACKYINGTLHSARAKDIDDDLPPDSEWQKGCTFPGTGKNVKYLYVEVYGAGGGGSPAYVMPWEYYVEHINWGESVPVERDYSIYIKGADGGTAMTRKAGNSIYNTSQSRGNIGEFYEDYWDAGGCGNANCCGIIDTCWGPCYRCCTGGWYSCNCKDVPYSYESCTGGYDYSSCNYGGGGGSSNGGGGGGGGSSNGGGGGSGGGMERCTPSNTEILSDNLLDKLFRSKYKNGIVTGGGCGDCKEYTTVDSTRTECDSCCRQYDNCCRDKIADKYGACTCTRNHRGPLPVATATTGSQSISGKVHMNRGDYISKDARGTFKEYNPGTVNGYAVDPARDAESYDYNLISSTSSTGNGSVDIYQHKTKLATTWGGTASLLGTTGTTCCTNCQADKQRFPNSQGSSTHCATNGKNGYNEIFASGLNQPSADPTREEGLYVDLDRFVYYVGCHGEAGKINASMLPTAGAKNMKFQVGRGGGDNEDGGDTFFSWVTAEGGKGAFKGCDSGTTDINKAKVANNGQRYNSLGISGVSNGGQAGDVKIYDHDGPFGLPERDYANAPSREDDLEPKGRWEVLPAGKGDNGMIIVSW